MTQKRPIESLLTILFISFLAAEAGWAESPTWHQWRGESQTGMASGKTYPTAWSETDDEKQGIGWSVEIPGLGGSTPVIANQTAFLTAGEGGKNVVYAVDTVSGEIKWTTAVGKDAGNKHKKGGGSNPSPITDGKHLYVFFRSGDLACLDFAGKVRWQASVNYDMKDGLWWDLGSSPILTDKAVVLAIMHTGPSYLVAFDKEQGEELWRADRELDAPQEAAQSYATPLNVTVHGKDAIAVMGADHLTLHAAADGKELGRLGGFNPTAHQYFRSISSPVAQGNLVICPYARGDSVTAVDMNMLADGKGKDAIVWFRDDLGSDVPTPAIKNGNVYFISDGKQTRGLVTCVDIQTGETQWELKTKKARASFSSSPLVAGDHLFVTREDATTYVIGPLASKKPNIVSTNGLADNQQYTVASPIPSGDGLLIRTKHNLYQITGSK